MKKKVKTPLRGDEIMPMEFHDPQYDAQTLMKADEIRRNSMRHKAAKGHAKKMFNAVIGKGRRGRTK